MSIVACGSNIVVQIPTTQSGGKTKGGLYIPETTGASGNQVVSGTVISVGPTVGIGPWNGIPSSVVLIKVGVTVWFQKPNSVEFETDGETYQILPENAILAVTQE
jgi:co-chaperonin GroES (HSP10)